MAEVWQQERLFFNKKKKIERKVVPHCSFSVSTPEYLLPISQEAQGGAAAMDHPAENFSENILLLQEHSVISR